MDMSGHFFNARAVILRILKPKLSRKKIRGDSEFPPKSNVKEEQSRAAGEKKTTEGGSERPIIVGAHAGLEHGLWATGPTRKDVIES
jgi:hypothetical protein